MRTLGLLSVTLLGALTVLSTGCGTKAKTTTLPATTTGGKAATVDGGSTGGTSNAGGGAAGGTSTQGGTSTSGGKATGGGSTTGGSNTGGGSTTGGTPTSGGTSSTGGTAPTGGTGTSICSDVASLPAMGTACTTVGESLCSGGSRCVCERGIWYCNNACPGSQPTPNSTCSRGAACTYNNGNTGCACINLLWMCVGVTNCPASVPTTGEACNSLTGVACDYPGSPHLACVCSANADAGSGSTWTCLQSAACPSPQPAYSLSNTCPGTAICSYSSAPNHCACMQAGTPWVCI